MGIQYNSTPANTGAFTPIRSGSAGYQNFSQGLPFYEGRSKVASIPEYQRNPGLLNQDVLMTIKEGRANFMRLLYEYAAQNGTITKADVKYYWQVNIKPTDRIYLRTNATAIPASAATGSWQNTFYLETYTRPTQTYPQSTGNPKVLGNIARLEAGQFLLLMWSWIAVGRTGAPVSYEDYAHPIPEIAKVVSVDYDNNKIVVERNWAGSQRTATRTATPAFTVVANSTTPSTTQVRARDAFFIILPRSMKEDEIDAKVHGLTMTWQTGIMQRSLKAWGGGTLGEVISRNLGRPSPMAESKAQAIEDYYAEIEWASLFGEKSESWDAETNDWSGTTDGLLTNIAASHHIGIVPIQFSKLYSEPKYAWGSFSIPIFTQILGEKCYMGSENKIALCGQTGISNFMTMINQMTQNVPDIKSEWKVSGKRFSIDGGLTVDFIQSDKMSLSGLKNKIVLIDPSAFRVVQLQGYPTDIVEVNNENPLKKNGFIHGVYSFIDLNPDAHWVFTLDSNLGSVTGATFGTNVLGLESA